MLVRDLLGHTPAHLSSSLLLPSGNFFLTHTFSFFYPTNKFYFYPTKRHPPRFISDSRAPDPADQYSELVFSYVLISWLNKKCKTEKVLVIQFDFGF